MAEMKPIPERGEIPQEYTWNPADMFPTDEAWQAEYDAVKTLGERISGYAGHLGESAKTLYEFVELEQETGTPLGALMRYSSLRQDEDPGVAKSQAM